MGMYWAHFVIQFFEISAAHYGAKSVLGLDISQNAIDMCNKNAALNGWKKIAALKR